MWMPSSIVPKRTPVTSAPRSFTRLWAAFRTRSEYGIGSWVRRARPTTW